VEKRKGKGKQPVVQQQLLQRLVQQLLLLR